MLKIGEFSKLSLITVKALRFYEKEGLLIPAATDEWTGYRYYDTFQLETAARIKAYRQLDLSIDEIKAIFSGAQEKDILTEKAEQLKRQQSDIGIRLSIINHILEVDSMKYNVVIKEIPEYIVYSEERKLASYADAMSFIPESGAECKRLNPDLECVNPSYEFMEYLDGEYKESDVLVRHNQAVTKMGVESDRIKFRKIPATKVLSIFHKGAYDQIGEAYAYLMKYAEENGYKASGLMRESYIDGIWNKDSVEDWLTEIQMPISD
ncbi:MAG: MerR family transcriptional regulator [Oscillospiraceae bacterium]